MIINSVISGGGSSGQTITATNKTGSTIASGTKVWVTPVSSGYQILPKYEDSCLYIYGSGITISEDKIASGFSTSSDYSIKDRFSYNSFSGTLLPRDFIFKGKLTSSSTHSVLLSVISSSEQYYGVRSADGHFRFSMYKGSWTDGTNELSLDTWYWFRVIIDNGSVTAYTLEDNNYTLQSLPDISSWRQEFTASSYVDTTQYYIGYNPNTTGEYWKGSLDLKNSIKKYGDYQWAFFYPNIAENSVSGKTAESIANNSSGSVTVLEIPA